MHFGHNMIQKVKDIISRKFSCNSAVNNLKNPDSFTTACNYALILEYLYL